MPKSKNIKSLEVKPTKTVILNTNSCKKITVQRPIEKQEDIKSGRSRMIEAGKKNLEKGKWKKGQSGNKKGRPPKGYSYIIAMLKKKGFEKITMQEYNDMEGLMLALPRKEMLLIGNDEELPMAWRIKAKEMLSDRGADQIETMADRLFGKPKQSIGGEVDVNLTLAGGLLALRKTKQRDEI